MRVIPRPTVVQLRDKDTVNQLTNALYLCEKYGLLHRPVNGAGWLIIPTGVGTILMAGEEDVAAEDSVGDDG